MFKHQACSCGFLQPSLYGTNQSDVVWLVYDTELFQQARQ